VILAGGGFEANAERRTERGGICDGVKRISGPEPSQGLE
jgi:hypothetical protein